MTDIELVIKIPEELYNYMRKDEYDEHLDKRFDYQIRFAIKDGTPLPKGHGDLIERNKLEFLKALHDAKYGKISWGKAIKRIKYSAPTIIEADKPESEDE